MDTLQLLAPKKVKTPDLLCDVGEFLGDEARKKYPLLQEANQKKIEVLVERLEFIRHLTCFAEFVRKGKKKHFDKIKIEKIDESRNKIEVPEEFMLMGKDLAGSDYDIEALVFYLLLTCIDLIKGQSAYKKPFEWILFNGDAFWGRGKDEFINAIKEHEKIYQEQYGLSHRFITAFTKDISDEYKKDLSDSLVVVKLSDSQIKPASADTWETKSLEEKIKKIAEILYNIRSSYTHAGIRNYFPADPLLMTPELNGETLLQKKGTKPVITTLQEIVTYLARKLVLEI
jgi:hypothetical protein